MRVEREGQSKADGQDQHGVSQPANTPPAARREPGKRAQRGRRGEAEEVDPEYAGPELRVQGARRGPEDEEHRDVDDDEDGQDAGRAGAIGLHALGLEALRVHGREAPGEREAAVGKTKLPPTVSKARAPRKNERDARKELKTIEKTIAQLDEQRRTLNAKLMDTSNAAEALRLHNEIAAITMQLEPAEERWIELGRSLNTENFQVIISAGPDSEEVELGRRLMAAIGAGSVSTEGRLSWAQLAWLLYQASLFVGVDTAAMHLAAACQVPVVALFGPTDEREWGPWQAQHELVAPPGDEYYLRSMNYVTLEQVQAACHKQLVL